MGYINTERTRQRNKNIYDHAKRGIPPASIAKIFKIDRANTVSVIIHRERKREEELKSPRSRASIK